MLREKKEREPSRFHNISRRNICSRVDNNKHTSVPDDQTCTVPLCSQQIEGHAVAQWLTPRISGEVAQWLTPRICSANREVGGSNLTVSTDDPLG